MNRYLRYVWVEKAIPVLDLMIEGVLDREEKKFYPFVGLDLENKQEALTEFKSGNRPDYLSSPSAGHNFWEIEIGEE